MNITSTIAKTATAASTIALAAALAVGGAAPAHAATNAVETFNLTGLATTGQSSPSYLAGASIRLESSTGVVLARGTVPASGVWKVALTPGVTYRLWVNKQIGDSCTYGMGHYYRYVTFVGAARSASVTAPFSWVCPPPVV